MQAIIFQRFGNPAEVLTVEDVPVPEPQRDQDRVRMLSSPINPSDLMYVRGDYSVRPELPATPGFEGVGIVDAHGGSLLGRFMTGKRVTVLNRDRGNWSQYTIAPARQVVPMPSSLSADQSAMFFVNPATAWILVRNILRIPRDAWLLQTAAGSALGRMIIRLGRHWGFRTINVIRREQAGAALTQLGADQVVVFDAERQPAEELREAVQQATGGTGVAFALDPVGGPTAAAVAECLTTAGQLVLYGTLSHQPVAIPPRTLMTAGASIRGFWLGQYLAQLGLPQKIVMIRALQKLVLSGVLSAEAGDHFCLDQIDEAVVAAETEQRRGKIILTIADA